MARHLRPTVRGYLCIELQEAYMATVPGPRPDRPLPTPGVPAERPAHEEEEERRAAPDPAPSWEPEPYDPEREQVEPELPAAVP
jgi:hypothetical protein